MGRAEADAPRPFLLDSDRAQTPKAAANVLTISGVSDSPTRPRIPDTLTINPA
jgi:hypothetical protein